MTNLWNIKPEDIKAVTPRSVLLVQAENLSKITKGTLSGSVDTDDTYTETRLLEYLKDKKSFVHSLQIYSSIIDYKFVLLRLQHPTKSTNPFVVSDLINEHSHKGESIEELEKILGNIFSSPKVLDSIKALL